MKKISMVLLSSFLVAAPLSTHLGVSSVSASTLDKQPSLHADKLQSIESSRVDVLELGGEEVTFETLETNDFTEITVKEKAGTTILTINKIDNSLEVESDFLSESGIKELQSLFDDISTSEVSEVAPLAWDDWSTLPPKTGSNKILNTTLATALAMIAAAAKVPYIAVPAAGLSVLLGSIDTVYWVKLERVRATLTGMEVETKMWLYSDSARTNQIDYKEYTYHQNI